MSGEADWAFGEDEGEGEGGEVGLGVMVGGEVSARGMEEMTRSDARGRGSKSWGAGFGLFGGLDVVDGGRGCGGCCAPAASSQAVRAAGSTGQAEGGGDSVLGAMVGMFASLSWGWFLEGARNGNKPKSVDGSLRPKARLVKARAFSERLCPPLISPLKYQLLQTAEMPRSRGFGRESLWLR